MLSSLVQTAQSKSLTFAYYVTDSADENDVTEHTKIDLDVSDFQDFTGNADWESAMDIYVNGKHSSKGAGVMRNLQGFSTGLKEKFDGLQAVNTALLSEYELFANYYGNNWEYADKFVMDALNNTGDAYNLTASVRNQLAKKGLQYQVIAMYVLRELYDGVKACLGGQVKVKAWDEGAAFFVGSSIGPAGEGNFDGYLQYTLGAKRCGAFNTCTNKENEPYSAVNAKAMEAFRKGQAAIRAMECEEASNQVLVIRKQMQVALIQGMLQYAYKSDFAVQNKIDMKAMAEAWAFTAAVLPFLDEQDPTNAAKIRQNMELKTGVEQTVTDGYGAVFTATYAILPKLCIYCQDIGEFGNGAPECTNADEEVDAGCAEYLRPIEQPDEPVNVGLIVGMSVLGVVVIALLIGVLVYMNKASKKEKAANQKEVQNDPETEGANAETSVV